MNINQSYGQTSFGKAYLDPKGVEKFCKNKPTSYITDELIKTVKVAKQSDDNDLILDENGQIYLQNKKYGKFTTSNPPYNCYNGQVFSVSVEKEDGSNDRIRLKMPTESSAEEINDAFSVGTFIPQSKLKLFMAMEAASKYEKEQEKLQEEESSNAIDILNKLSD